MDADFLEFYHRDFYEIEESDPVRAYRLIALLPPSSRTKTLDRGVEHWTTLDFLLDRNNVLLESFMLSFADRRQIGDRKAESMVPEFYKEAHKQMQKEEELREIERSRKEVKSLRELFSGNLKNFN